MARKYRDTTFPWGITRDAQEQTKEVFIWGSGMGELEEGCMKTPQLDQIFTTGWEVTHGRGEKAWKCQGWEEWPECRREPHRAGRGMWL